MGQDNKTLQVYNARAAEYQSRFSAEAKKPEVAFLIAALPKGAKVLDLGAGPGTDAAALRDAGLMVTALEPADAFADIIEAKGIPVRRTDFEALEDVAAFDAVLASFSLLHAPRAKFPGHIAAIHRALRPGGHFVIGMKTGKGEGRDKLGRFYAYYGVEELQQLLCEAGFTVTDVREGAEPGLAGPVEPFVVIRAHA